MKFSIEKCQITIKKNLIEFNLFGLSFLSKTQIKHYPKSIKYTCFKKINL